jgi:nucleotide-binding universal stress UspA family protein
MPRSGGLIVFGDDGSPIADTAWSWIAAHHWAGWRVEVVTATEVPLQPPAIDHGPALTEWVPPRPRIPVADSGLEGVRHLTAAADPRILLGDRDDADLLVVGTRGLNPVQAVLLGSTAEWLIQQPPAPLAVIRSPGLVERVLVAADGSGHAQRAVEALVSLPWIGGREVEVVSVDDGRTDTRVALERAGAALAAAGIGFTTHESQGSPAGEILARVRNFDPQLVVVGNRGLTGMRRLHIGSTAGAVIRHGHCSALVATAGAPG